MPHTGLSNTLLGQATAYVSTYTPTLLCPISRNLGRGELGFGESLPFAGVDIWTAYELSWLDLRGKPVVAMGEIRVPFSSPNLIESKSLKLYLGSFNQTRFGGWDEVKATIEADLSEAAGDRVFVELWSLGGSRGSTSLTTNGHNTKLTTNETTLGICLDDLNCDITQYTPDANLLSSDNTAAAEIEETLYSHLLKSNCPVTGQPDWATVFIHYRGKPISRTALLRYIVSFREHSGFHEQCVEQIFRDIWLHSAPNALSVYARYTRRGGLDINPYRYGVRQASDDKQTLEVFATLPSVRDPRQ
jgi:7-cyano-7-deazaguanine reductase